MMRMLVSVRSVAEARVAAQGGADFIDLKEPRDGALGGLPIATIARASCARCAGRAAALPISATIGDLPMTRAGGDPGARRRGRGLRRRLREGRYRTRDSRRGAVLDALAATGHAIVPVFIVDRGLDFEQVEHACAPGFPALMVDTADKLAGSLFDVMRDDELRALRQWRSRERCAGRCWRVRCDARSSPRCARSRPTSPASAARCAPATAAASSIPSACATIAAAMHASVCARGSLIEAQLKWRGSPSSSARMRGQLAPVHDLDRERRPVSAVAEALVEHARPRRARRAIATGRSRTT